MEAPAAANPASPAPSAAAGPLAGQAARWIVLLTDDDAAVRERARGEFEAWKRADPRHARAAAGMEAVVARLQSLRGQAPGAARAALDAAFAHGRKQRRAKRLGAAALVLALCVPGWLALRAWPLAYLAADVRTAAGEWRTRVLPDGTRVTLGGKSAVNLHYDDGRRAIELVQGEILVDVAKDASRPFLVDTAEGRIRALGTRFAVDREGGATLLGMIESSTAVLPAARREAGIDGAVRVDAGQQVRITPQAVGPVSAIDARSLDEAWQRRQLVADDRLLADVLDELSRHRPGLLRYDRAQIAGIRVSAVLPLDDTDRALRLLQASFPALRVRVPAPFLTLVDAPPAGPQAQKK